MLFSADACTTFQGGAYDSSKSTSRKRLIFSDPPLPDDAGNFETPAVYYVSDHLALGNGTILEDYPIAIAEGPIASESSILAMMQMGLGVDSVLLKTLKDKGLIASRSWGFWWGRGFGMSSQTDGSLVLGGYDKARVVGDPLVADILPSPACVSGLSLPVSDVVVHADGVSLSLLESVVTEPQPRFCLDPYRPNIMRIPLNPTLESPSLGPWIYNPTPPYSYSLRFPDMDATAR